MNSFFLKIIIFFLFSLSLLQYYTYNGSHLIDSQTAKLKIQNKEIEVVIDVRTQYEYDKGHFPGALHVPVQNINRETIDFPKSTGILVYCNTGQRARRAAEMIQSLGYTNVSYIAGSYKTIS